MTGEQSHGVHREHLSMIEAIGGDVDPLLWAIDDGGEIVAYHTHPAARGRFWVLMPNRYVEVVDTFCHDCRRGVLSCGCLVEVAE